MWVCNVPDYCVEEMADHSLAFLLALVRGIVELDRSVRDGRWDYAAAGPLRRIADIRLGIIGFGRIGRALAVRALALGMDVVSHDPVVSDEDMHRAGVRPAALDELLATSDAISVHAPLTAETRGLIGREQIALLPSGAVVVNASRAALVDAERASRALEDGRIAGVALDVLDVEPPTMDAPAPGHRVSSSTRTRVGTANGRRRRGRAGRRVRARGTRWPARRTPSTIPVHAGSVPRPMGERPHILVVMVDQLAASFLRAYGHPVTRTPTIDRLAEEASSSRMRTARARSALPPAHPS